MSYETPNRTLERETYDGSPAAIAQRHKDNEYRAKWHPRLMFLLKAAMFIVLALSFAGRG